MTDTARVKILLVDDNVVNLTACKETLRDLYDIFPADSAQKMFKILERIIPDLILLDVEMPEMSGYEAIKILKETPEWKQIPVIFLTSRSDEGSELTGLSLGAVDYIMKPFSAPLLRKRMENHLMSEAHKKSLQKFNTQLTEMVRLKTEKMMHLQNALLSTLTNMVEFRDDVTGGHVVRTQRYLEIMIEEMIKEGVYKDEISAWEDWRSCASAAQLHDIGKIAISDTILNKPGKLTDSEFSIMMTHVNVGLEIIERLEPLAEEDASWQHARNIISGHHERWDGFGYPTGLHQLDIPLEGRLMAIADVYDALVSERPYKKAYTTEDARHIILRCSGTHFDPALVKIFSKVSDQFAELTRDLDTSKKEGD